MKKELVITYTNMQLRKSKWALLVSGVPSDVGIEIWKIGDVFVPIYFQQHTWNQGVPPSGVIPDDWVSGSSIEEAMDNLLARGVAERMEMDDG